MRPEPRPVTFIQRLVGMLALLLVAGLATASVEDPAKPPVAAAKAPDQAPDHAPSKAAIKPMVDAAADRHGVEKALVHAVVAAESAYNPRAVSPAGAVGLMQVMPATAADYGVTDVADLFDPKTNLDTGTRHLRRLLSKYQNDYGRVIMAYNAGEGVVDRTKSNVTYRETLDYTAAVIRHYRKNGGRQPTDEALQKVAMLQRMTSHGKARALMKRYLDPSLLKLPVRPTLSLRHLDPGLHKPLPDSKPMFELQAN